MMFLVRGNSTYCQHYTKYLAICGGFSILSERRHFSGLSSLKPPIKEDTVSRRRLFCFRMDLGYDHRVRFPRAIASILTFHQAHFVQRFTQAPRAQQYTLNVVHVYLGSEVVIYFRWISGFPILLI
uniref:Uncharacterized protein n=1 Tax=Solanum demissum TaxID=50514 RepID=Q6AVY1_SOLDE|nr:hypothetical protein SDM1_2t00001 [Solanum demissum]